MLADSDATSAGMRAVGRVTHDDGRWSLRLELDQREHHALRELQADDCVSLSEAAAWLVSVAIDPRLPPSAASSPTAAALPGKQPAAPSAEPAAASAAGVTAAAPVAEAAPSESGLHPAWRVGIFTGAFFAGFAGPAGSLGVQLALDLQRLSVVLSGAHHFERTRSLGVPGASAELSGQELSVAGCHQWGDAWRLGPCGFVSGHRTHGRTHGVTVERSDQLYWAALGATLAFAYRISPLFELGAEAGLSVPISARPRFEVTTLGSVGEAAVLAGRLRLGINLRLP